ncbi:MAG TPA: transposase [Dehalococcoidia bacterium]|nr:transposase [Dehalococcoidia bacterium]
MNAEERTIVLDSLRHWDGSKWDLYAAVVMPSHVHALVQPRFVGSAMAFDLSEIIHSVKSFSAHSINKLRGGRGPIWQDERHDRIVRNQEELQEKWRYIRDNAVKAGLAAVPEEYPWLYEKGEEHRRDACAT